MANQTNQSLKSNNPSSVPPAPTVLRGGIGATTVSTTSSSCTSLIDRPVVSRPISLPLTAGRSSAAGSGVTAMASRPSRSATRSTVASNPFASQSAGMRVFKKCKSATFQIDGHTYTIGKHG
uniref:Uncharacterized protein n=1 Tax=Anopheles atroparvus TaxID=41427 RepID=A0A182JEV7_ANOAO